MRAWRLDEGEGGVGGMRRSEEAGGRRGARRAEEGCTPEGGVQYARLPFDAVVEGRHNHLVVAAAR